MALNYDKERHLKDGQRSPIVGNPIVLSVLWLGWALLMSYFACWVASVVHSTVTWFRSPASYAILGSNIPPGTFDILKAGWSLTNLGNYQVIMVIPLTYWVTELAMASVMLPLAFKLYHRWKPNNHNQYGNDRLTTEPEIQRQYPQIPDRGFSFPGYGGIPVAHATAKDHVLITHHPLLWSRYCLCPWLLQIMSKVPHMAQHLPFYEASTGFYAIDNKQAVNSLIVGITRSGKGETIIMPLVDILSRAQKKSSMVINDPKGELYQMSYDTLRKRGYDVEVLNIQKTDFSMSYNPLQKVIDYAKDGYYDEVQQEVNTLSTSIYADPNAKDKFWQNSSINLLNALVLAIVDYAKRNNKWEEVTMDNVLHMMTELGAKQVSLNKDGDIIPSEQDMEHNPDIMVPKDTEVKTMKNKLIVYFEHLQKLNEVDHSQFRQMALDAFAQSKFAGDETSGNIYSSAMEGIKIYQQTDIAKLTSMNSVNFEKLGFPRTMKLKLPQKFCFKTAVVSFLDESGKILEKRTQLIDKVGMLKYAIETKLPDHFNVQISFDYRKNDPEIRNYTGLIHGSKVYERVFGHYKYDEYTKKPILKRISLQDDAKDKYAIKFSHESINYSEAPVALFFVTPPNNPSYNQLPAFAVDQIFNSLYAMALDNGRKCFRRVHFILDEFGGMPAINDMSVKAQICLGQNICFTLVVQNLEQLSLKYSREQAATIQSNCSNLLYILTKSKETAQTISSMIGKRTVAVHTDSGKVGNVHSTSYNTSYISQDILSMNDLLKLMGGEMVVLRSVYRQDQKGHAVSAMPIFDHGRTKMPYRYTFLRKEFNDQTTLSDIGIKAPHRDLDLKDNRVNYDLAYNQLIDLIYQQNDEEDYAEDEQDIGNRAKVLMQADPIAQSNKPDDGEDLVQNNQDSLNNVEQYPNENSAEKIENVFINKPEDLPSDYVVSFEALHDTEFISQLNKTLFMDLATVFPVQIRKSLFSQTHDIFYKTKYNSWSNLCDLYGGDANDSRFLKLKHDIKNLTKQWKENKGHVDGN
ncbi:VirD4-like conjugal transfer protein, CD1115 family [Limosilactobacillus coleohominis]|uniref:VirD4-like conjugal transfer protein, CD1115 family n=1 Tax=Limosilactobacillus coleohominis TaxID=181675 RepID=UPI0026E96304|nr:type IV secretory system conjugative DNA transfer family protein [Limosilactobacillus coleohominis]